MNPELQVKTYKSNIYPRPWQHPIIWLRIKRRERQRWRWERKNPHAARLAAEVERKMERAFIFGEEQK